MKLGQFGRAFIKLNRGLMQMPVHWQLWIMLLVITNLVTPLFFLGHLEAQLALAAILANLMLMTVLTGLSGFTRLLGLGQVFWIPLLVFLWVRLDQIPANDAFGIWIRLLMALNAASLVIDASDVIRYIAGDREETIKGL